MNPYRLLGIRPDAGVRDIKRAYASRLKQARPDRDPEGYQRLREAYDAVLSMAQHRERQQSPEAEIPDAAQASDRLTEADKETARACAPSDPEPCDGMQSFDGHADATDEALADHGGLGDGSAVATPPPPEERTASIRLGEPFDFGSFVTELMQAGSQGAAPFERWLLDCPALFSLELKEQLVRPLMSIMATASPPLTSSALAILLHFFRLDSVGLRDFQLSQTITMAQVHSEQFWKLQKTTQIHTSGRGWSAARLVFRELSTPLHKGRRAAILLIPGFKGRMRRLLAGLPQGYDQSRYAMFDRSSLEFWRGALDPRRVSKWRLLSMCVSMAAAVLLGSLLSGSADDAFAFAVVGLFCLSGWVILAINDARKLRLAARAAQRPARRFRIWLPSLGINVSWRWIVFAIMVLRAVMHGFSQ